MRFATFTTLRQRSLPLALLILISLGAAILLASTHSEASRQPVGPRKASQPGSPPLEFDVRGIHGVPKGTEFRSPTSAQLKAIDALHGALGVAPKVQYNGLTATPRHLFVDGGYLTPPRAADPEVIARDFLHQWASLFRFSEDDLNNLKLKSRATLPDTGTTILLFEQQLNNRPVYHGEVLVNVAHSGQIIDAGGESFPQMSLTNSVVITPAQAVTSAAAGLAVPSFTAQPLGTTPVLTTYGELQPQYSQAKKFSRGTVFGDDIIVEDVVFPLGDQARLAYKLTLTTPRFNNIMWQNIVDAETGVVLRRISLTSFVGPGGGGTGVGRRGTFRPDVQDLIEANGNAAGAQGKVFDTVPTAISGTGGFGGSTRTGTNPGNYVYTGPTYGVENPLPTDANGRGFRNSLVQARNEDPLMFSSTPGPFTHAQLPSLLSQVLRGFPDALQPSASSPFGWFYLPTGPAGAEIANGNTNRAGTRAIGYSMAAEAKSRNLAANSPGGSGDQPFSATSTALPAGVPLRDGRVLFSVIQSNYTEGNNVFVADDRENDNELTHGIKAYSANRQFTAGYFDFVNSYYYGGVDATSDNMGLPCDPVGVGPCLVIYPASANPDVYPGAVNLFYFNNIIHDYLYSIGFTESLWNFQQDNFGKGGAGGDALSAQVQDGSGTDNANMSTPAEGSNPRMQMYLFSQASFTRSDGSVDWDVVAHEHYHGVSNRSAAKGGDSCLGIGLVGESGGMGEGWSDYNAESLSDDDAEGEYVTGEFDIGIRRLPVANFRWSYGAINGCALNRRDQGTADHDTLCLIPFEVHTIGEVWSATLWDMRELLIFKQKVGGNYPGVFFDGSRRLGSGTSFYIGDRLVQSVDGKHPIDYRTTADSPLFDDTGAINATTGLPTPTIDAAHHLVRPGLVAQEIQSLGHRHGPLATALVNGARLSDTLVLRGLQLSPCNPTFIDERESILRADKELTGGENQPVIWRAFASHGIGTNASSSGGGHDPNGGAQSAPTIVEDFTVPAGVTECETLGPLSAPNFALANPSANTVTVTIAPIAGAANYVIARSTSASGPFTTIADIPATQTAYQDNDGGQGLSLQTYYYQVHAGRNPQCVSAANTNSIAVTLGVVIVPAPIFLGADQILDPQECSTLTVSWQPAFTTNPNASIVYDIYRVASISAGDGTQDPTFTPSAANRIAQGVSGTSYVDSNLTRNQTYYYIVQARDTNANKLDTNNTGNTTVRFNAPTSSAVNSSAVFAVENFENSSADARFTPQLTESAAGPNPAVANFQRVPNADLGGGVTSTVMYAPDFSPPGNTGGPSDFATVIGPLTLTADSLMEFDHRFAAEATFDGGVIEVALNAPTFNSTPFPDNTTTFDLGNYMLQGGYNGKLNGKELGTGVVGSPLQGRRAYTGVRALHHVRLSLRAFAPGGEHAPANGQVYVRFRMTSDAATTAGLNSGWLIDDLVVNNLAGCSVAQPTIQFSAPSFSVTEGCTAASVTVVRSGPTSTTATVDYTAVDGSAQQHADYEFAAGRLTFNPGDTSRTIELLITDDGYAEGTESFNLSLGIPSGAQIGPNSSTTVNISDNDTSTSTTSNVIDDAGTFVCEHYHDFLNRQGDPGGQDYWTSQITQCAGDAACIRRQRIGVSAAFFIEQEFQQTGFYVYRIIKSALGRRPTYVEFMTDRSRLLAGSNLDTEKVAYTLEFVGRGEFTGKYPASLDGPGFVDALIQNVKNDSGVDLGSHRSELISEYNGGADQTDGRARVLRKLVEYDEFKNAEFNRAFVLAQYFGYLRREPDDSGYNFWLSVLNAQPNNFRGMVCAFITADEYQDRFGAVRTHSNAECSGSP